MFVVAAFTLWVDSAMANDVLVDRKIHFYKSQDMLWVFRDAVRV
jgi:hypothetical protein